MHGRDPSQVLAIAGFMVLVAAPGEGLGARLPRHC